MNSAQFMAVGHLRGNADRLCELVQLGVPRSSVEFASEVILSLRKFGMDRNWGIFVDDSDWPNGVELYDEERGVRITVSATV